MHKTQQFHTPEIFQKHSVDQKSFGHFEKSIKTRTTAYIFLPAHSSCLFGPNYLACWNRMAQLYCRVNFGNYDYINIIWYMIYDTILSGVCHIFLDKAMSCASFSAVKTSATRGFFRDQRPSKIRVDYGTSWFLMFLWLGRLVPCSLFLGTTCPRDTTKYDPVIYAFRRFLGVLADMLISLK